MAQPSQTAPPEDGSTRERMLDAALSAFAELGYDGASTREIASRAGVNQGLIPYYFGSKEALWREAVNRAFSEIREGVGLALQSIESGEPNIDRAAFAAMIRDLVRFAASNPEFHRLMTDEGKRDGPRMHWIVDNHVRPIYEAIETLAARAGEASPLAVRLDPLILHYLLVGASTHLFHQAPECLRLTGRDPADPDIIAAHTEALIALFVGPEPNQGESR